MQKIIEPELEQYCTRQACYAAAVRLGLSEEFKAIKAQYEQGKKHRDFSWLLGV